MSGLTASQRSALQKVRCEVRFDDLTRVLYATDASIYRVEPWAVAYPGSAGEASEVLRVAADCAVPVIPRGAGTGLTGGALGEGLVVEMSVGARWTGGLDRDRRTIRVGAGVVLDRLNGVLAPFGLWFGPDVATSSRATVGGMIANNSSGAHAPVYGTTVDHVQSLQVVLADGTIAVVGRGHDGLAELRSQADGVVDRFAEDIRGTLPDGLVKRWPGYGFDRYLGARGDLSRLVAGSEGTLALVTEAELRVVPMPARRGLGVLFFDSVAEAMQATVEVLDLAPAAVEHVDRVLFDQTRGQRDFAPVRTLLRLDEQPCEAMLLVEFFDEADERLQELGRRRLGRRRLICGGADEQAMVWAMRKAGLSLVTARTGPAKPAAGIEDVCVRPERLPAYVNAVREILDSRGLEASFYGHAAAGLLHVRPVFDLHTAEGVAALRAVADDVSALCRSFGGSLAGEHGLGIARTAYLAEHVGPQLTEATGEVKRLFDPRGVMNPGKIVDTGRYRIDSDLRLGDGAFVDLPFAERLGHVDRDGSFVGNLEQCNGCGGCRKDAPTMCPTFVATGEEIMSTRGRANTVRAVLEGRLLGSFATSGELEVALSNCLSCKACKRECPSNVDLALLKAELLNARHQAVGIRLRDRVFAAVDRLGRVGTSAPRLANAVLGAAPVRWLMERTLDIDAERPLPAYAQLRFDRWFADRLEAGQAATRERVILWDDTWVRYHEPHIGQAAVAVLEAAGHEVVLADGRECCGRPACSRGLLDEVRRLGEHNLGVLTAGGKEAPIIFLEPSCHSMFVDEYRQLQLPGAEEVAARCQLFEAFMFDLLDGEPEALPLRRRDLDVVIHGHCHAKALGDPGLMPRLAERVPGVEARLLDTGCCGMAGAFGMLRSKAELSRAVAAPLVEQLAGLPPTTRVVASGVSCRHQIVHLTDVRPLHMAELLAAAL